MIFLIELHPESFELNDATGDTYELCCPQKILRELEELRGRIGPEARVRAIALTGREQNELTHTTWPKPSDAKELFGLPVLTHGLRS